MTLTLWCVSCSEVLAPLVASVSSELIAPDFEQIEAQVGPSLADKLRDFHQTHRRHFLREEVTA